MRPRFRFAPLLFVTLIAGAPLASAADATPDAVQFEWGVKIPLRDGVHLNATVYKPRNQPQPLPCVFTLTPYIAQSYHDRGMYFAAHGYVFLTVDVRGRGNSEGEFTPLLQEAKDGHDVVEWLGTQPMCSGKVTMWGGSYAGYDQWASAKEFPSHLATIVPVASPKPGVDYPMQHNMFYSYDTQWLTLVSGHASQENIFGDSAFWSTQFRRWYEAHAPFRELDRYIGNPSPHFQTWLSHPAQDAYWDSFSPTPEQYAKLSLPVLSICGQYDGDQPGALAYYRDHMQYGSADAKANHYLIIGPWDHAGTRTPKADVGGLKFGPGALVDMNALHVSWYDWTMKAGARPEFLKDKVAFYVTGEEAWRYAPTLDSVTARNDTWYLDSTAGRANDVFAAGALGHDKPGVGKPDHYVSDPLDVGSAAWEQEDSPNGLTDQRGVMLAAGKALFYHSPPLTADTDIAGFFKLSAWLSINAPDTDIGVGLAEVKSDGSSVFLASDSIRARYRHDLRKAELVKPGSIERYDFSRFTFVARRLAKGSRLRLTIAPINSMYAEKNYNSGGVVADESGKDARTVTVTLYHDGAHPSALSMPIAAVSSSVAAK
ncbi:MAG: CocE/NonD family hydrolase [Dokdonella sp.]|uniref:CocE/NonD family hydrolase n=1 Tax=Dokdonella sp. TaxID=2291710 RepID=UPI003264CDB9